MEQLQSSPMVRRFNFRPLLQRLAWAINIFLFSTVFWAFIFCLGRLN